MIYKRIRGCFHLLKRQWESLNLLLHPCLHSNLYTLLEKRIKKIWRENSFGIHCWKQQWCNAKYVLYAYGFLKHRQKLLFLNFVPSPQNEKPKKVGEGSWGTATCCTRKETSELERSPSKAMCGLWKEQGRGRSVGKEGKKIGDTGRKRWKKAGISLEAGTRWMDSHRPGPRGSWERTRWVSLTGWLRYNWRLSTC